jgi:hypothetical protein
MPTDDSTATTSKNSNNSHLRLFERNYSLFESDLTTLMRLKRLHGHRTAAEALSYLLREYGEPELLDKDPEGLTVHKAAAPAAPRKPVAADEW